ncbi:MAG: hypothetical protein QW350_05185 [Candidatus Aenigmatarchaeota archaeon]
MKKIYIDIGLDTRIDIKDVEKFQEYQYEHERNTDIDLRPRTRWDTCQITTFNVNTGAILYSSMFVDSKFSGTEFYGDAKCFHELMTQIEKLMSLYEDKNPEIYNLCVRAIISSKFDDESYRRPKIVLYDVVFGHDEEILAHDIFFAPSIFYLSMEKILLENTEKFSKRYPRIYDLFYKLAERYDCRIDKIKRYLEGAFHEMYYLPLERYRYELEQEVEEETETKTK